MTFTTVALITGEAVSGNDRWYEIADGFIWSGACGAFQPSPGAITAGFPGKYRPLVPFLELGHAEDVVADEVRDPLLALKAAVENAGGRLERNSLTRTSAQQQVLRDRYVAWLNAGKPPPEVAAANQPGRSNHQGGRAIDVRVSALAFPNVPADKQLDRLWELAIPLGWTPIIKSPSESQSESWHFDWWGSWRGVKDRLGYDLGCLCSALDVGQAASWQSDGRLAQALLLRAGFDIGEPDDQVGPRTRRALALALGGSVPELVDWDSVILKLRSLPAAGSWQRIVA